MGLYMTPKEPYRDKSTLEQLYWGEGLSVSDIADRFDVAYTTIYRWMRKHGIETREANQNKSGKWRDENVLRELYIDQGLTIPEVSDVLDCGKTTVHRWLKKHNIKRRRSGPDSVDHAAFFTDQNGYERAVSGRPRTEQSDVVLIHRLLAVATGDLPTDEFGDSSIAIHHNNGIKWDNRPDNIETMTASEHSTLHYEDRKRADNGDFKS